MNVELFVYRNERVHLVGRLDYRKCYIKNANELLRAPYDFCEPSVSVEIQKIPCTGDKGRDNHIIVMHIEPSMAVHANQADEAYIRVRDKSKKLTFEERTQLMYDKGERYFEDKSVPDASVDDIDMEMVQSYIRCMRIWRTSCGKILSFTNSAQMSKFLCVANL